MDNAVKRFRQRRDARLRKRMDEEGWITINGTHVMIDDKGQVSKGPAALKSVVNKSGGYKAGTKKSAAKPGAGETVHAGGKDWTVESLTQLWKDRGYGARKAKAQAEKDFKEMKAAQKNTRDASVGSVPDDYEEPPIDLTRSKKGSRYVKEYADKIGELARSVRSEKEFSDLVERAADDDRLSNDEYEEIYSKALDAYRETAKLAGTRPTMRQHESDLRDLLDAHDQDKIGTIDFEEKMDKWADKLPVGTTIQLGKEGMDTYQVMKKTADGKFTGRDKYGDYDMSTKEFTEKLGNNLNATDWANDWDNEGVRLYAGEEGVSSSSKGESSSASNVGSSLNSVIDELKEDMRANKGTLRMEPKKKAIAAMKEAASSAPTGTTISFANRRKDMGDKDTTLVKIGDNKWRETHTRDGKKYENEVTDENVMHTLLGSTVLNWRSKKPMVKVTEGGDVSSRTKGESTASSTFKTPSDYKKALSDRDSAMSEKVLAEDQWKKAKAYRASMAGKTEESLKADIDKYRKSGDTDKLDRAQHDLERYQAGVKKYGKDFGVAAAEKKMNEADKKWSDLDKRIKSFEESRGYGKKTSVPAKAEAAAGGNEDRDYFVKNYKNGRLSESRGTLRSMPRNSEIEFEGNKYVKVSDDNGGMWGIKKRNGDVGHSGYSSAFMIDLVDDWLKRNPKAKVEDIKFTRG